MPPCPFLYQRPSLLHGFLSRLFFIPTLLLSPILVPLRILLLLVAIPVFSVAFFFVNLGTDLTRPLPPRRDAACQTLFRAFGLYVSVVMGCIYKVKNRDLRHHPDAPVVVSNHCSNLDGIIFSFLSFGHPIGKEGVISNWFSRQIFLAARVILVKRPASREVREALEHVTSPSASEAEIAAVKLDDLVQQRNNPLTIAKVANYQKILAMRKRYGIGSVSQSMWDRAHHREQGWHQLVIFPEGTITNGSMLARFRTGAFRLQVPVQPVTLEYRSVFPVGWLTDHILVNTFKLLANPITFITVTFHKPLAQLPEESTRDFADRVGRYMADALHGAYTPYTNDDMLYLFGYKDLDVCTQEWLDDYGWIGRISEFRGSRWRRFWGHTQAEVDAAHRRFLRDQKRQS